MVCQFWPIQFWPIHFRPIPFFVCCCGRFWCGLLFCVVRFRLFVVCVCCVLCVLLLCVFVLFCCCVCGCVQGPSAGRPFPWTAQNFALFFPSPATVFILFSLSCWPFSLNFGGVFEDRDPQMCTFGLSGCRVKPRRPHQTGPPGLAHDSPRTPNVHISGPLRFKHHQNSTRRPPREKNE